MSLFLGEYLYFYKKNNTIFHNRTDKVFLKFIVFIYLVFNLTLLYSTYIYPVAFTYKTRHNIFFSFFASKLTFLYSCIFGKCMFCYFIDIRALSCYENDLHIVNISNGNNIYHIL